MRIWLAAMLISGSARGAFAQAATPPGWKWVTDRPATMVDTEKQAQESPERLWFVQMPPGFHITMGPGGNLFDPSVVAAGRFDVESEFFLFPGESGSEYGLFIGGQRLESGGDWIGFVARRDGSAAVTRRRGGAIELVRAWRPSGAIVPGRSEGTARNVLKVIAGTEVVFQVNGADVARVPRDSVAIDGVVGFRVGSGVNLHVTSFDVLRRLAPTPAAKR